MAPRAAEALPGKQLEQAVDLKLGLAVPATQKLHWLDRAAEYIPEAQLRQLDDDKDPMAAE